ncbi:HupE/UreJ family protein [Roseateles depolymerans]|uniref:Uncharacterized protein n=1 Tax=Roseateles depolymerans TaxID=76731 RepID=A0A0U2U564_9BURK|nr:HupE/UreJ family protein [Roseateles depolymerans]ALV07185.1 hypothetical protein RD2015_2720 [Roseateles depolymerans]REG20168.1 HupE/UreJ protein [Roseateles depolymerans]
MAATSVTPWLASSWRRLRPITPWLMALLWLALLTWMAPVEAHKASDAYLRMSVDAQQVTVRTDVALRDLDRELVLDADGNALLTWGEVRARRQDIQSLVDQAIVWRILDALQQPCEPGPASALQLEQHSDGRYAVLQRTWTCSGGVGTADVTYRLFAASDPTHRGILLWRDTGVSRTTVLAPDAPTFSLLRQDSNSPSDAEASTGGRWAALFRDGVHHIWVGVDHVLFLVVLLLPAVLRRDAGHWVPAQAWRPAVGRVVAVVTAFTVAHSITLGLAVFDVVQPPSRWVESLIALSVLLAALNNLRPVVVDSTWRFTFVFGLVHGFGFASALKDLGLSRSELAAPLVLFNLGVEAGQLAIVSLVVPIAWWARRWSGYRRWVLRAGSVLVAGIAAVWLVERLLEVQIIGLGA